MGIRRCVACVVGGSPPFVDVDVRRSRNQKFQFLLVELVPTIHAISETFRGHGVLGTHNGNQVFWNDVIEAAEEGFYLVFDRFDEPILRRKLDEFLLVLIRHLDALTALLQRYVLGDAKLL